MTKEQILKRIEELEKEQREWDEFRLFDDSYDENRLRIQTELASCQTALESFVQSIVE